MATFALRDGSDGSGSTRLAPRLTVDRNLDQQPKAKPSVIWNDLDSAAVLHHPLCSSNSQFAGRHRRGKTQNAGCRRAPGPHARWRVLDDDTVRSLKTEGRRSLQIGLRMRFAITHIAGGNHMDWGRKAGSSQPCFGKWPRARRCNVPSIRRQRSQEANGPGERHDALKISDLPTLDFFVFQLVVSVREKFANRRQAGTPMSTRNHCVRVESVLERPFTPDSCNRRSRINQYAIQIKKQGVAFNHCHQMYSAASSS